MPPSKREAFESLARGLDVALTLVGSIERESGVRVIGVSGEVVHMKHRGFEHFDG